MTNLRPFGKDELSTNLPRGFALYENKESLKGKEASVALVKFEAGGFRFLFQSQSNDLVWTSGIVESGETISKAAVRSFRFHTGYDVSKMNPLFSMGIANNKYIFVYVISNMEADSSSCSSCSCCTSNCWISKKYFIDNPDHSSKKVVDTINKVLHNSKRWANDTEIVEIEEKKEYQPADIPILATFSRSVKVPEVSVSLEGVKLPTGFTLLAAGDKCRFISGVKVAGVILARRTSDGFLYLAQSKGNGEVGPVGGFVESGETALVAARRECMEECGFDISRKTPLFIIKADISTRKGPMEIYNFIYLIDEKSWTNRGTTLGEVKRWTMNSSDCCYGHGWVAKEELTKENNALFKKVIDTTAKVLN